EGAAKQGGADPGAVLKALLSGKRPDEVPRPLGLRARGDFGAVQATHLEFASVVSDVSVEGLPAECWPRRSRMFARAAHFRRRPSRSSHRVGELAAEAAKLKKVGVASPFVLVDLKKWLPEFAALKEVLQEEDREQTHRGALVSRSNLRNALLLLQDLLDLANAIKANGQEGKRKTLAEDACGRDEKPDAGSGGGSNGGARGSSDSGTGGGAQNDRRGSWSRGDLARPQRVVERPLLVVFWRPQAARAAQ
ncbi:unnamed protein product, partial [Prorocentrum cordatum]